MRIRAFFLLSLSAAAAVGLFSAVVTVVSEWRQASAAAQAQQLAMAIRAGLSATEHLALERGYYLADMLAEPPIDAAEKAKIDKAKAETDVAFAETDRPARTAPVLPRRRPRCRNCARSWRGSPNCGAKAIAPWRRACRARRDRRRYAVTRGC